MVKIESYCSACSQSGYCQGGCSNQGKGVKVYYCDECGDELDEEIYQAEGKDLCGYCLKEKYRKKD